MWRLVFFNCVIILFQDNPFRRAMRRRADRASRTSEDSSSMSSAEGAAATVEVVSEQQPRSAGNESMEINPGEEVNKQKYSRKFSPIIKQLCSIDRRVSHLQEVLSSYPNKYSHMNVNLTLKKFSFYFMYSWRCLKWKC